MLGATLAVPDGQPLVWALRALGHAGATRVYGPDLMAQVLRARGAQRARRSTCTADATTTERASCSQAAARALPRACEIVGGSSPPFRALTPAEDEREIELINSSGAQVVWVGTGQPKQERWMHEMRPRLAPRCWSAWARRSTFTRASSTQAPPWMRRNGLEWAYRL